MRFFSLVCAVALSLSGCGARPDFVRIGPGLTVSTRLIDEYMAEHGVSRDEAKAALATEVMTSSGPRQ